MKQSKPYGDEKQQEDSGNALDHSAMGEDLRHLSDVFVYVQLSSVINYQTVINYLLSIIKLKVIPLV